jgi:phosphate acyltransferase
MQKNAVGIVVDAEGGDFGATENVPGALAYRASHPEIALFLVGDPGNLQLGMKTYSTDIREGGTFSRGPFTGKAFVVGGQPVTLVYSEGKITDNEHSVQALRQKRKASIAIAMAMLHQGFVDALFSTGSTGATTAAATILLRPSPGIDRICVAAPIYEPFSSTILGDLGTSAEAPPRVLLTYAILCAALLKVLYGIEEPTFGLCNMGVEAEKGPDSLQQAHELLTKKLGSAFIGNVEPRDILAGKSHIALCSGFLGNQLMKLWEVMREELPNHLAPFLNHLIPSGQDTEDLIAAAIQNPFGKHGAPILGLSHGVVVVGHGNSKAKDIELGLETTLRCFQQDLPGAIKKELWILQEV